MSQLLCDLAQLLDQPSAPVDETGALAVVRKVLQQYRPSLLMVADAFGRPVAVDASQSDHHAEQAKSFAAEAIERLGSAAIVCWCHDGDRRSTAFAVRACAGQETGILCGLLAAETSPEALAPLQATLEACGALALLAIGSAKTVKQLRVRVAHLKAQQETLADSYEKAVAATIEEHQQRLSEQKAHFSRMSAVMQTAADAIITADEHGRIEMFNRTAEKIFGYSAQEIIGQPVWLIIPPAAQEQHQQFFGEVSGPRRQFDFIREVSGVRKDGTLVPLLLSVSTVEVDERPLATIIARDITEQKRREEELARYRAHLEELVAERTAELQRANQSLTEMCHAAEQANEAKTRFLANMSHELRTPLHGILSFAAFGVKESLTASPERLRSYFEKIDRCGKSLLALINDLLDLAKLESGKATYDFASTDLRMLALSAADEQSSRCAEKGIRLLVAKCPFDTKIVGDAMKLLQVFRNLLDNAIKFSPQGSTVEVLFQQKADKIQAAVCDQGVGIPENELEAIFDKFVQSSKTRTSTGGTGLGLAICREIVTAHRGRIWAENRAGGGAAVCFELPFDPRSTDGPVDHTARPA